MLAEISFPGDIKNIYKLFFILYQQMYTHTHTHTHTHTFDVQVTVYRDKFLQ